jgi:hypothetical protein
MERAIGKLQAGLGHADRGDVMGMWLETLSLPLGTSESNDQGIVINSAAREQVRGRRLGVAENVNNPSSIIMEITS